MKLFLAALTIWSLPFFGLSCGSTSVQQPERAKAEATSTPSGETVTLTSERPAGSFSLQPELFKKAPAVLEVSVTKVVNPAARAISIFVYLSPLKLKDDATRERIEVGNFSLYPADRPAKFMLDPAPAFRKVSETNPASTAKEWRLVFELERGAEQASSPIEVTIAAPSWKSAKG